jgi:hypothetical protein
VECPEDNLIFELINTELDNLGGPDQHDLMFVTAPQQDIGISR